MVGDPRCNFYIIQKYRKDSNEGIWVLCRIKIKRRGRKTIFLQEADSTASKTWLLCITWWLVRRRWSSTIIWIEKVSLFAELIIDIYLNNKNEEDHSLLKGYAVFPGGPKVRCWLQVPTSQRFNYRRGAQTSLDLFEATLKEKWPEFEESHGKVSLLLDNPWPHIAKVVKIV